MKILKRDGRTEKYDEFKVKEAVRKAMSRTENYIPSLPDVIEQNAFVSLREKSKDNTIPVDSIHTLIENLLMQGNHFDIAREYISYRSFWTFKHFNYDADVQQFKVDLSDHERTVVTRAMLAIGQVEVAVKTFWVKIGDYLPKPEIQAVGAVFGDSEVRHADAYTHLLEILGLNSMFKDIDKFKPLANRRDHLKKKLSPSDSREEFLLKVLLFSTFVENVSLFSQFLVMQAFDKETNRLSGLANAIEATSKEEDIHFQFGIELIKTMKQEHPELWTSSLLHEVKREATNALFAEFFLIDWLFDNKDLPFIKIDDVKGFVTRRMANSLKALEIDFDYTEYLYDGIQFDKWFEQERVIPANTDFFHKKVTDYSKGTKSFTEDDLF